jgi:hypothetical protein
MFVDALSQGSLGLIMFLNGCLAGIAICIILEDS